jgi:hypothetical protein
MLGPRKRREDGQASVELVALLPLVALLAFALVQLTLAGHAAWAASQAAGAAARAHAVGLDPKSAARSSLPTHLERSLRLRTGDEGEVEVRLRTPVLLRQLDLGHITAHARFEPQS